MTRSNNFVGLPSRMTMLIGFIYSLIFFGGCSEPRMLQREDLLWEYGDRCSFALVPLVQIGSIVIGSACADRMDTVLLEIPDCLGNMAAIITMNRIPFPHGSTICTGNTEQKMILDPGVDHLGVLYAYPVINGSCFRYRDVVFVEKSPTWRGEGYQYWLQFRDAEGVPYSIPMSEYFGIIPECSTSYGDRFLLLSFSVHSDLGRGHIGILDLNGVVERYKVKLIRGAEYREVKFDRRKL